MPDKWTKAATLIADIAAVDTTVFQHNGLWWLMCTQLEHDPTLNLFVWYAQDLFGPWKPHAGNPVKTDVRSSRPAGTPFAYNGELYRPSQDCSNSYGGRIVINRVRELTPRTFKEEVAAVVEPYADGPYPQGIHTLSAVGDMTLVDGKRYKFVASAAKSAILRRLRGRQSLGW